MKEKLVKIPKPIYSDFIIDNGNGLDAQDGRYYHFTEVIRLLKLWDKKKGKPKTYCPKCGKDDYWEQNSSTCQQCGHTW